MTFGFEILRAVTVKSSLGYNALSSRHSVLPLLFISKEMDTTRNQHEAGSKSTLKKEVICSFSHWITRCYILKDGSQEMDYSEILLKLLEITVIITAQGVLLFNVLLRQKFFVRITAIFTLETRLSALKWVFL
jgi:hypothetical protein